MTRRHIPARPTLYKGVLMRSRTEARFAQALDVDGVDWEYEPVCFADETGQYLPDGFTPAELAEMDEMLKAFGIEP